MSIGLSLVPGQRLDPVRGAVQSALRPGQRAVQELRQVGSPLAALLGGQTQLAARLLRSERQCERLEEENQRLAAELAEMRNRPAGRPSSPADLAADRLLMSQYVPARALGQQARAFLARRHILDAGSRAGIEPEALVIDPRPGLIDRGSDVNLRAGQVVVSQGRVWGKIATVGPLTSTVLTATDAGYRDLVVIGQPRGDDESPPRAQGVLEGTGEPLARIRLVDVTRPVSEGDPVYSAAVTDLTPEPLLYGRVARVQRPVGAAHWEIWMKPAIADGRPDRVVVGQAELNPGRIAGGRKPSKAE